MIERGLADTLRRELVEPARIWGWP